MIRITARCQNCPWRWLPRKHEGPDADTARAGLAARRHSSSHPGHVVTSKREERSTLATKGSRVKFLSVEITVQR